MTRHKNDNKRMRIAVIGSGIAGNAAAWALTVSTDHDVTVYEARGRAGGHSATVDIDYAGTPISVDTGFIVYNELNYPNLTALFELLGVRTNASDMSFGVSIDGGRREWASGGPLSIFAQPSNLVSPSFYRMLGEILRFNRVCEDDLNSGFLEGKTLGEYLEFRGFAKSFIDDYLLPMGAAIWSTPVDEMLTFPAASFVAFFVNHRLIDRSRNRPQWRTVAGGSRNYVEKLIAPYQHRIRFNTSVDRVERRAGKVHLTDNHGGAAIYDHVIFATHTDQTRQILADPTPAQSALLDAVPYRPNTVYLHRDPALMPKRKAAWSSWNYIRSSDQSGDVAGDVSVTYWMNRLQNIPREFPLFVSLNPNRPPRDELIFATFSYAHPQFGNAAVAARSELPAIQGRDGLWFCGAWTGHGFHEDGLVSGLDVAEALGATVPWRGGITPPLQEAAE